MIIRMKRLHILINILLITVSLFAQEVRPVKNVIVMIPDGTSLSVYSAARWYKYYNGMGESLNIDPYFTGTVTTFSSHAPIGDSAPTGSTYATGVLQQAGNVAIYPETTDNDLYTVDAARTWQPAATILEALKIEKKKAVGLVVTSEFTHATPADFSAHHHKRNFYKGIAPQIAYQNLDVMFGGGNRHITPDIREHLKSNGTALIQNNKNELLNYNGGGKVWALFREAALPYNIDRNPEKIPSLAEMTEKALQVLSANENGFFLMVEGSQVDWAAHANDPATIIDEYLAFDEAVGKVMAFAKEDGNTAVVIMSDHGTGGLSIGTRECSGSSRLSIEELFGAVSKIKISASGLESILIDTKPEKFSEVFKKYTDIEITDEELLLLHSSKNYKESDYTQVGTSNNLAHNIVKIMNSRSCFGFTTGSHTGEEVLMAAYHPQDDVPRGNMRNTDINRYLQQVSGLDNSLEELTDRIFVNHNELFKGMHQTINRNNPDIPVLMVTKGRTRLEIPAFSSVVKKNGKPFDIGSVVVYIDKNDTFYLPATLADAF